MIFIAILVIGITLITIIWSIHVQNKHIELEVPDRDAKVSLLIRQLKNLVDELENAWMT